MNVKNKERIERMVISLEAILETEKGLSGWDDNCIRVALWALRKVNNQDTGFNYYLSAVPKEFDEDDLRV